MSYFIQFIPFITHTLIGLYFVFFGFWNIYHWQATIGMMVQKKIPHPWLLLSIGIAWQTVLGFMILFNIFVWIAALLLIPFTIIATIIFHPFWQFKNEIRVLNLIIFLTNTIVTVSALLLLVPH